MNNPVATLAPGEAVQKLKYYQKGTFTVGNRLVAEAERSVQASPINYFGRTPLPGRSCRHIPPSTEVNP